MGCGDLILDMESGRPLGMSRERLDSRRDSRLLDEDDECLSRDECLSLLDECLDEDECFELRDLDELEPDSPVGTSRMFNLRPVVGSTTCDSAGSWVTWYPSMM